MAPLAWIGVWILIYSYLILASVDFGASFYLFYGQEVQNKAALFSLVNDFLSPVSEVINICFVFLFAAVAGFSPELTFYYQTPLAASAVLAVVITIVKGTFFAVGQLKEKGSLIRKICMTANGIIGVLIPPVLSIPMVISEGDFVSYEDKEAGFFLTQLLTNLYFWSVFVIAVVSVFYISAMFLTLFAHSLGNRPLSGIMRSFALFWSVPTVLASGLVFLGLEQQNPEHFMAALNHSWLFLFSLVCLLAAVTLLFLKRNYLLSFVLVMLQYFFALAGYSLSHLPYLIYPDIKISPDVQALARSGAAFPLTMAGSLCVPAIYLFLKTLMVRRSAEFKRANRST
ncbi:cytochrome d ubiquinol oxidase subunit II [Sporolactobacillus sp. THM7-4]|nr:cytochrome d ubiquinol oxidase subunit II [Sporolactobacillus sp. THM7-4]